MHTAKDIDRIYKENLAEIIKSARDLFTPREMMLVSEWSAKYRFMSSEETARPGKWDNSITPFAVEPMDAFILPEVERVTFWGSAQVVKTEMIKNLIGYIAHQLGDPALLIYPSEDDARDFSTEKLDPMLKNNPEISSKIAPDKAHSKENKTLFKKFLEGGFLAITGSNAPQKLARRSVKYVMVDDADRVGRAGQEGDAVDLSWERTETYALLGRKLLEFSTTTIDGQSRIQSAYELSDQREYYVPCPFCGHMQTLYFFPKKEELPDGSIKYIGGIRWEKTLDMFGNTEKHYPDTAYYQCENEKCQEHIEEKHKTWKISNGTWIPKYPDRIKHRGYKINRLYSPFSTWSLSVDKFLNSRNDSQKLRVVYNTHFAIPFKIEEAEQVDETGLLERCENYCTKEYDWIPNGVLMITAAVDVQADRLEVHFFGWGNEEEAWAIGWEAVYGDPNQKDVWNDLDEVFKEKWYWKRGDGLQISVSLVYVDSGDGKVTLEVYDYTRRKAKFVAIKGQDGFNKPVLLNRSKVGPNKNTLLQNIGVDAVKMILYKRLNRKVRSGPGIMHFSKAFCDIEYFTQLTAEKAVKGVNRNNRATVVFKKKTSGARNEKLDLWVYGYAAMRAMKPNWTELKSTRDKQLLELQENNTKQEIEETPVKQPKIKTVRKSRFVNRVR